MKKILFIILCLTISLAGCSRQPKEYGVFIGIDSEEIHKLDRYSIVIIEPSAFSSEQIGKLHAERKTVYGYLRSFAEKYQLNVVGESQDEASGLTFAGVR